MRCPDGGQMRRREFIRFLAALQDVNPSNPVGKNQGALIAEVLPGLPDV